MRRITGEEFIGQKFGRLLVVRVAGFQFKRGALVECQCECGVSKVLNLGALRYGDTASCGCLLKEMLELPTEQRIKTRAYRPGSAKRSYESKRASQERWKSKNKDKVAASSKRFRERHKEKVKALKAEYFQRTKGKSNEKAKRLFKTDPRYRIEATLRSRIRKVLKRQNALKSARTMKLIGCSLDEFKAHIQSLFTEGMTWERFMAGEIHVDHLLPCRSFNLLDPAEQLRCFHFTNHGPKWALDNLQKSDKLPDGTRARDIKHPVPESLLPLPASDIPAPLSQS